jgi:hypothetical protein
MSMTIPSRTAPVHTASAGCTKNRSRAAPAGESPGLADPGAVDIRTSIMPRSDRHSGLSAGRSNTGKIALIGFERVLP